MKEAHYIAISRNSETFSNSSNKILLHILIIPKRSENLCSDRMANAWKLRELSHFVAYRKYYSVD